MLLDEASMYGVITLFVTGY